MATISWNDSLLTGHKSIDLEHKLLITCIELAFRAVNVEKKAFEATALLNRFYGAYLRHCVEEESLMRNNRFDGFEPHKAEHDALQSALKLHAVKSNENNSPPTLKFLNEISWLFINHIITKDKELVRRYPQARK